MNPPSNQVDKYGFPIPPKFEEQLPPQSRQAKAGKTRAVRWVLFLALIAVVASIALRSPIAAEGKRIIAKYLAERAIEKYQDDNIEGALADIDQAVEWLAGASDGEKDGVPDPLLMELYRLRSHLRLEGKDLEGSLADCDRLLKMQPKAPEHHIARSLPLERLGRHREAIDALSEALKLTAPDNPEILNNRAYFRALGGIELEDALKDAETALQGANERTRWTYLDTRGYVHFLLGNLDKALADLDQAIETGEEQKREILLKQGRMRDGRQLHNRIKKHSEGLAVLYHHRGQIHEKLGHADQAKADLARGDRLGYNPDAGVY